MWEYLTELFTKPELQRTFLDNVVLGILTFLFFFIIFAAFYGIIALGEVIENHKKKRLLRKKMKNKDE